MDPEKPSDEDRGPGDSNCRVRSTTVELIQCPQNVRIIEEVQENWFPAWKEFGDTTR